MKITVVVSSLTVFLLIAVWNYHAIEPGILSNSSSLIPQALTKSISPTTDSTEARPSTFSALPVDANPAHYVECIHGLGRKVPQQEQVALVTWITGPKPSGFDDLMWLYLNNEVMDRLGHQDHPLPNWTDILVSITSGTQNHPGQRDYAIQHLVDWIQPTSRGESFEANPVKRQEIVETLLRIASQPSENFSGTALLGLHHILNEHQRRLDEQEGTAQILFPLKEEQLHPVAISLASGAETALQARVTALQVCAERGYAEILPISRTIASDRKQPAILRLSAIAAIGQIGTLEDATLLKSIQADSFLQNARGPALKKLEK